MVTIYQTIFSNVLFFNENVLISNTIWLKVVAKTPIGNTAALVQIMAMHRTGHKPLSESMMTYVGDASMRHSASMS